MKLKPAAFQAVIYSPGNPKPQWIIIEAVHVDRGLAVHAGVRPDVGWVISHVSSGQRFGPCHPTMESAIAAMARLLELKDVDWTRPKQRLPMDDQAFRDRVREALGGILTRCEDPAIPDDEDHL